MDHIGEYQNLKQIDETKGSLVYQATKENDDYSVIIKLLKSRYPTKAEIARFKQEYNIIQNIDLEGIVKIFDIISAENSYAIIMEDFNGVSLSELIDNQKMAIDSFLKIAIQLSETLGYLHQKDIIHKDIKPRNIIVHAKTLQTKITDFGISSVLTRENEELYNTDVIQGTLFYMSPEQTGRMNRTVDYRSDLYSLGITFYQMIAGDLPFKSNDPLEIIYSHIAKNPVPLIEIDGNISPVISDIVMKLLKKTPEERYQNSFGLLHDLKECETRLHKNGKITEFNLAEQDIPVRYMIPQVILGRDSELEILLQSFDRVSNGKTELLLVSGAPGLGKSALINEVQKPIIEKKGYFLSGKYDAFRRDIPYSSIIQGFQGLIRQVLTESSERLTTWKEKLQKALGSNGKIITDIFPGVEHIIGKQEEPQQLDATEAQNRFNFTFREFVNVFADEKHPLVLFLDDLQWADIASLNLLEYLITDGSIEYLLVIGAYRDNEVSKAHSLMHMLSELKKKGMDIKQIPLSPLDKTSVNLLVSGFLRCDKKITLPLSEVVFKKTNGNPFFINQFMKTLYEEKILTMDPVSGWHWDMETIKKKQVTDNVVEMLAGKISRLPDSVQHILKICSCIGNRFNLEMIADIDNKSIDDVLVDLTYAINEGYVSFVNDMYKFSHDRIHEAIYSLISRQDKSAMHYKIGRILLEKTDESGLSKKIIFITDQWNRGIKNIAGAVEKKKIAELNLKAGMKSISSSAFESARHYFRTGIDLLSKNCWKTDYELAYSLYTGLMECEYMTSRFTETQGLFDIIVDRVKTKIEKAEIHLIMVKALILKAQYLDAIKLGIKGLKIINYRKLPLYPTKWRINISFMKIMINFDKKLDKSLSRPLASSQRIMMIHEFFTSIGLAAGASAAQFFLFLLIQSLDLDFKYGLVRTTPTGLTGFAITIIKQKKDYNKAYELGDKALQLLDKREFNSGRCRNYYLFTRFILPWKKHISESVRYLNLAYNAGLEEGDHQYRSLTIVYMMTRQIVQGKNLTDMHDELKQNENFILGLKSGTLYEFNIDFKQYFLNMTGQIKNKISMNSGDYDEEKQRKKLIEKRMGTNIIYHCVFRIQIYYLHGNFYAALGILQNLKSLVENLLPSIIMPEYYFYYSLVLTGLYEDATARDRKEYWKIIGDNQKRMKNWAENCEANFLHKYLLIEAETARLKKEYLNAIYLYDRAITSAAENRYANNQAIANELAAKFYMSINLDKNAQKYMTDARYCYLLWGVTSKVEELDEQYSGLITEVSQKAGIGDSITEGTLSTSTGSASDVFDISTIMKSTRIISGEIVLHKLLEKMISITMENAGAKNGILLLQKKDKLYVEARGDMEKGDITVLESIPVKDFSDVPLSVIQFVQRTKEYVILDDAASQGSFTNDPYIVEKKIQSVLCSPVLDRGRLVGILYLENNLATSVFTPARLEIIKILSSQIAISIDNAQLYANMEEKVKERTAELRQANEKLNKAMDALWGEMKLAQKIQTVLLPEEPSIPGYEISAYMEPAENVGGDYYDVINTGDINWVVIGDVSGHGVSAGLVMMMVQTAIHNTVDQYPELKPAELLVRINRTITANIKQMKEDKYMTITVFAVHKNGEFVYSGAHQDLFIYRAESDKVDKIELTGVWIGIMDDIAGQLEDNTLLLEKGDSLLLYTDGIIEARAKGDGKIMGEDRFIEVFKGLGQLPTRKMLDGILTELNQNYITDDDVTLMILKYVQ